MFILGLTHPISWNTAAVLLEDGRIVAAAEEERFLKIKHAPRMIPYNAINYVLKEKGILPSDVDAIAISWDGPHSKDEISNAVKKGHFVNHPTNLEHEFWNESVIKETALMNLIKSKFKNAKTFFVRHHIAHASSACFVSGFDESLFITIDGRGEYESGLMGIYRKGEMEIIRKLDLDESLGDMYASFTNIIGFKGHSEEGKIMGLAPYGNIIDSLLDIANVNGEGKIEINWNKFGSIPNNFSGSDPTQDERKNLAATAQFILEKCVLSIIKQLTEVSKKSNICLAGGCALNIDMNGAILSSGLVNNIFVQPGSHDAGCALGAALYVHKQFSSKKPEKMSHAYLGPSIDDEKTKNTLDNLGIKYSIMEDTASDIADLISKNKIIGWMQGRMEFGPRALGARSLLANPTDKKMWEKVNKVKGREYWRPLAPSVIEDESTKFFDMKVESPFMLLKFNVIEEKIKEIPAVVHVDKSARPQTVSKHSNNLYWKLLKEFKKISGVPVLINTSLNPKGEPIVNEIEDGLRLLFSSDIDYLCMGKYLVYR